MLHSLLTFRSSTINNMPLLLMRGHRLFLSGLINRATEGISLFEQHFSFQVPAAYMKEEKWLKSKAHCFVLASPYHGSIGAVSIAGNEGLCIGFYFQREIVFRELK